MLSSKEIHSKKYSVGVAFLTEDCLLSEPGLTSTSLKLLYGEERCDEFYTLETKMWVYGGFLS
jgi:hypothetical protein